MIEMYKILSGKYDTAVTLQVNREYSSITRENNLRLQKTSYIRFAQVLLPAAMRAAQRAGIYSEPILRFFAPQGRHVAPMG